MTGSDIRARAVVRDATKADELIGLSYEARLVRRKRLVSDEGRSFVVDLPEVVSLNEGDAFQLDDGTLIGVRAAEEDVLKITGDLTRLAWHIGNRHMPCQIEASFLVIQDDHVLAEMLRVLGAEVVQMRAAFMPEGGAYGHGRTFAHDHGPHSHTHD